MICREKLLTRSSREAQLIGRTNHLEGDYFATKLQARPLGFSPCRAFVPPDHSHHSYGCDPMVLERLKIDAKCVRWMQTEGDARRQTAPAVFVRPTGLQKSEETKNHHRPETWPHGINPSNR